MANLFGRTRPIDESRSVPTGDTVGRYTSYLDAQKAVDYLADHQFPVQLVSIVGNDLKMVERVTGKLSYPRVALSGALTGAWFGLFVGVLLTFFGSSAGAEAPFSVMTSIALGAGFWMLFGIAGYAMQRGKRDFTSTSQVLASSYDVIVAPEVSGDARRLLAQLPMSSQPVAAHTHVPSQPYQPPHIPGNVQTPPQRPSGWTDPYPHPTAPATEATQPPVEGAVTAPSGTTPGTFPDLPDGRPQYGVRVEPAEPAEESGPEQPAPDDEAPRDQQL